MDIISLIIAIFAGLISIAAIIISLLNMGKTGPQGATGPQGVTGPIGETGPTGATGSTQLNSASEFRFSNGVNGNINISEYNSISPYMIYTLSDEYIYLTGSSNTRAHFIIQKDNNLQPGHSFIISTGQLSTTISSDYYLLAGNPINTPMSLNPSQTYMFTLINDGLTLITSYWSTMINNITPPEIYFDNIVVPPSNNITLPEIYFDNIVVPPSNDITPSSNPISICGSGCGSQHPDRKNSTSFSSRQRNSLLINGNTIRY